MGKVKNMPTKTTKTTKTIKRKTSKAPSRSKTTSIQAKKDQPMTETPAETPVETPVETSNCECSNQNEALAELVNLCKESLIEIESLKTELKMTQADLQNHIMLYNGHVQALHMG